MRYGYARTSREDQPGNGQIHRLTEAGIKQENIYFDPGVSGMKASRPEWDKLQSVLQAGDYVTVTELSRIGRSVSNVLDVMESMEKKNVGVIILDINLDTTTPTGRMVLTVLAAVARLERDLISERTKAAMAALRAEGVQVGRKRTITDKQLGTARKLRSKGMSVTEIAETMGVPRSSLYALLKTPQDA